MLPFVERNKKADIKATARPVTTAGIGGKFVFHCNVAGKNRARGPKEAFPVTMSAIVSV